MAMNFWLPNSKVQYMYYINICSHSTLCSAYYVCGLQQFPNSLSSKQTVLQSALQQVHIRSILDLDGLAANRIQLETI